MILGTVRKLDSAGRIQIPINIREKLALNDSTSLNIFEENGRIIITPFVGVREYCCICGIREVTEEEKLCQVCKEKWGK